MSHPLISIIVPIYNVDKYLERCIDSIVGQTYKNLETILVDDGSTDESGEIADRYADKDKRVRVIHKENGGVSSARNAGIKESTGDYIMFVDADDKIDERTCEICIESIKNDEDLVSFSLSHIDENEKGESKEGAVDGRVRYLTSNKEIVEDYLRGDNLRTVARLFKRATVGDLVFDESMRIHEDALFAFKFLEKSNSAVSINIPLYFYISRPGSAMKNFVASDIKDVRRHYDEVMEFFSSHYPELKLHATQRSMATLFNLLTIAKQTRSNKELTKVRSEIRKNRLDLRGSYDMLRTHKIKWILSYLPLPVFNFAINVSRRHRRVA